MWFQQLDPNSPDASAEPTRPWLRPIRTIVDHITMALNVTGTLLIVAVMVLRPMQTPKTLWPVAEAMAIRDFVGVTTNGVAREGLFEIASSGASTAPVADAASALLASLSEEQRARVQFPVDDDEWRRWANWRPELLMTLTIF